MTIHDTYYASKNSFLFNDSVKFSALRENIINNFVLNSKVKKNNESLKHLDPHVLEFFYKYNNLNNKIIYEKHDEDVTNINVVDGKILNLKSNNLDNCSKICNIKNQDSLVEDKFLNFQNLFKDDYVLNLNSLMLNSGYHIDIKKNEKVNFFISNSVSENDLTIFQKNFINCSKNTRVFIIENYICEKKSNNNTVNYINLEDGSNVTHLIFQKNSEKANVQSTSYVNCNSHSNYKQLTLNISMGSIRNHHYASLLGENTSATLDGIFFGSNNQILDNKTQVNHNFPNCTSSQRYKGILTDQAKASYLSKTFVDKLAQKTQAYQLSKGILLSDNSYFHSKPELKIYADDVKCSHGSTIGPIDKDLLFYLRSRGLDKKKSTSLLIKSFFHDIISEIDDNSFVEKFNYYSNIWLKENNI